MSSELFDPIQDGQLDDLVDWLRDRDAPLLDERSLAALLSWLSLARTAEGRYLVQTLGAAGQDEDLLDHVFFVLDDWLFDGDRLSWLRAGVGIEADDADRRRRFRLLLSAYHPDRFPDRSEHLTARSQAILQAYGSFKQGRIDPDPEPGSTTYPVASHEHEVDMAMQAAQVSGRPLRSKPGWLSWLRRRWGQDRWFAHKVIALMAVLASLPVLDMYLGSTVVPPTSLSSPSLARDQAGTSVAPVDTDSVTEADGQAPDAVVEAFEPGLMASLEDDPSPEWLEYVERLDELVAATVEQMQAGDASDGLDMNLLALQDEPRNDGAKELALVEPLPVPSSVAEIHPDSVEDRMQEAQAPVSHHTLVVPEGVEPQPEPVAVARVASPPPASAPSKVERKPDPVVQMASVSTPMPSAEQPVPETPEAQACIDCAPTLETEAVEPLPPEPVVVLSVEEQGRLRQDAALDEYRRSIEAGDLAALGALLTHDASENSIRGRQQVIDLYRSIFQRSLRRSLRLNARERWSDDDGWMLEADFHLEVWTHDDQSIVRHGTARYRMRDERDVMLITSINY